jgi:hypothetical protein
MDPEVKSPVKARPLVPSATQTADLVHPEGSWVEAAAAALAEALAAEALAADALADAAETEAEKAEAD